MVSKALDGGRRLYIYLLYIEEITIDTSNYTIYRNQYIYILVGGGVGVIVFDNNLYSWTGGRRAREMCAATNSILKSKL